jgi:hypothetical protein
MWAGSTSNYSPPTAYKGNFEFQGDFMLFHGDFAILHPLVDMGTGFMMSKALEGGLSRNMGPTSCKFLISIQPSS